MTMKQRLTSLAVALALPFALAAPAMAQSSDDNVRQDLDALKQGQKQIQQDLAELKKLLQQRQAPAAGPNVAGKVFNLAANPVKGMPSARLTLIEFMDYQ
jgi:Tfp pilus assembly protein PilN